MNLYLISQTDNTGYDTYDSAVVCASSAEEARFIHPARWMTGAWWEEEEDDCWAKPHRVSVLLIGKAHDAKPGVICASFNAG